MDNASSSIKMPPKKYYMMLEGFLLEAILKEEFVENWSDRGPVHKYTFIIWTKRLIKWNLSILVIRL